jgi:hypothetical protein
VQRALEKLRERLGKLGFAAVLPDLGEQLARLEAPAVPQGLEARLLALKPAAFALSSLVLPALVLVAVSSAAVVLLRDGEDELGSIAKAGETALESPRELEPAGEGRVEVASAAAPVETPENMPRKRPKPALRRASRAACSTRWASR